MRVVFDAFSYFSLLAEAKSWILLSRFSGFAWIVDVVLNRGPAKSDRNLMDFGTQMLIVQEIEI